MSGPYKLRVVLRFGDHRWLTDIFKDQVERGVRDNLQAAFGNLAKVEVVRTHPRLKDIEERGLQALDNWKEVSEYKTHFVLIDYVDNSYYEVRARQHDGLTGQASPVISRQRTESRDFLARTIGLMLDNEFGIVGEITNPGDELNVEMTLKGAGLGVPLSRWAHAGDVFGVVRIVGGGRSEPVPWAILQAQDVPDKNGVVKCRFHHRHRIALRSSTGSLRCIKLNTLKHRPLRLRLVKYGARTPTGLNGYQIRVQRLGLEPEPGQGIETATNPEGYSGLLGKDKPFDNVAFVLIYHLQKKNDIIARVPVPILDDRPVVIALNIQQEAATPLEFRLRFWLERISQRLAEDKGLFDELSAYASKPDKRAEALQRAKVAKVALIEDIHNLTKQRAELVEEEKETPGAKLDLTQGDQWIKLLERDQDELDKFIDGQDRVVAQENDPKRQEFVAKWEQGKALEREKEYGEAIKLYEEAQKGLNDPGLAKYLEKLKAGWEEKGAAHKEARHFIYKEWPEFDATRMKKQIEGARKAFETCRDVNDSLAPQKLLRVALSHDAKLKAILADLHPDVNEEQQKPYEDALAAINDLARLMGDVTKFLSKTLEEK
jgi:hypothetical protein